MAYQVIARKWRPQVFEQVVGQEAITRTLRNGIETGRLHHAYLFSGARGVGKTTTARLLAKALNCRKTDKPNPVPCDTSEADACVSCLEIAESRSMDVLEFDAASHTKVDEIREIILESININPARDRYKVFIIDEVHMLSKSSFNALLKTLEEPPENVVFVMATTEHHKVPDTITSRCQEFEFRTIPLRKILGRLETIAEAEHIDIRPEALKEIARSGEGSMRDAESNFDQVISFSGEQIGIDEVTAALGIAGTENLVRTIKAIADRDSGEMLRVVDDLVARGHDLRNFCRDLMSYVRDLLVFKIAGDAHGLLDTAILSAEEMKDHAAPFLEADFVRFFNSLAETEAALRDAAEPRYVLEIGLVKLSEMRRIVAIENILSRLAELETPETEARSTSSASAASAVQEKKTPESVELPAEPVPPVENPVQQEDSPEINDSKPSFAEEPPLRAASETRLPESPSPKSDQIETEPPFEPNEFDAPNDLAFDPDLMPVRLEAFSSEDLEHADDPWLDAAYERALMKEGDDASPFEDPGSLIFDLLGEISEADEQTEERKNSSSPSEPNRAIEIAKEMTEVDEDEGELPELPEDASEEELRRFAEAHPLVKRAKRLFRAEIVEIRKK